MGLFTNNKKLCPICGNPTPRLLAMILADDIPICKYCANKVDLPDGALGKMSVEAFKEYLAYYDGNEELRKSFSESYRFGFGFLKGALIIDSQHRLFRLKDGEGAFALEASNLHSFCILEDNEPLFEGTAEGLICHKSSVPEKVKAMQPRIAAFKLEKREYEFIRRQEELQEERLKEKASSSVMSEPTFEEPAPVDKFYIELSINHPYWGDIRKTIGAPAFDRNEPSIEEYMDDYEKKIEELRQLADNLMSVLNPGAPVKMAESAQNGAAFGSGEAANDAAGAGAVPNAAEQIKQFKELLDAGAITEEEYAAKKKQLLGI